MTTNPDHINQLAAIIREVDRGLFPHELAEAILSHPASQWQPPDNLAQLEGEGITDDKLMMTYAYAVAAAVDNKRGPFNKDAAEAAQLAGLRAVLARWGRPTPLPAPEPGEVGEVCEWLESHAAQMRRMQEIGALPETELQEMLDRAATLLQQQESRIANLRSALADCGRAVGGIISDDCSDAFLLQVPAEVRLAVAKVAPAAPLTDAIAAARAALAQPEGEGPILQWTENMPPCEDCRYDHCTAETPFGRFLISWKSWKQFDSPTVDETPWGDWYGAFNSVDEAKAACQKEMDERLARWSRPTAPPALPANYTTLNTRGRLWSCCRPSTEAASLKAALPMRSSSGVFMLCWLTVPPPRQRQTM
jgi:hypothetical protein